ncbi:MAG: hypothetical protein A2V70_17760 [Planctomycetes bacterium RBG_13_63_9]|nr:MAG: hypothetical protein A2V70_17760 [Planctomycetes bacterium RBG_13_63_9]
MPTPNAWLKQQLDRMQPGISLGKTRRRKVESTRTSNVNERTIKKEVRERGWKLAQIGLDYVFAPGDYTIRPIV